MRNAHVRFVATRPMFITLHCGALTIHAIVLAVGDCGREPCRIIRCKSTTCRMINIVSKTMTISMQAVSLRCCEIMCERRVMAVGKKRRGASAGQVDGTDAHAGDLRVENIVARDVRPLDGKSHGCPVISVFRASGVFASARPLRDRL